MSLLILDRDGVINQDSKFFIKNPEEWIPIPGSLESISRLSKSGWNIAVATNQSGLARGIIRLSVLKKIHEKMHEELAIFGGKIDKIFFCPHQPEDYCQCRKPFPGMINNAISYFHYENLKSNVFVIGDSLRDLQASESAACRTILVLTGNGYKTLKRGNLPKNTLVFKSLSNVADFFLCYKNSENREKD